MELDIQAICNKGLVRSNNEDAISVGGFFLRDESASLKVDTSQDGYFFLLVCDGMGGHDNGEEASEYALGALKEKLASREVSPDSFEDDFRRVAYGVSSELNGLAASRGQVRPMGCTLTGVVWYYGKTWLLNAGDSRTYRFRNGILRQLTTDDTDRGITGDPDASKLLHNCLGGGCRGHLAIEDIDDKLLEGDILLICSDGLCDMVPDEDIEEALSGGLGADDLLRMAYDGGGTDNISIIVATIGK